MTLNLLLLDLVKAKRSFLLAVADASLGAQDQASHAHVFTIMKGDAKIESEVPVDCDPDDLENTSSETYSMIAIHTLTNVICDNFEIMCGEISIYCDNIDVLGKNKLTRN